MVALPPARIAVPQQDRGVHARCAGPRAV